MALDCHLLGELGEILQILSLQRHKAGDLILTINYSANIYFKYFRQFYLFDMISAHSGYKVHLIMQTRGIEIIRVKGEMSSDASQTQT